MYLWIFYLHVESRENFGSTDWSYRQLWIKCWELNLSSLTEQSVLLTTAASLPPTGLAFKFLLILNYSNIVNGDVLAGVRTSFIDQAMPKKNSLIFWIYNFTENSNVRIVELFAYQWSFRYEKTANSRSFMLGSTFPGAREHLALGRK